MDHITVEYSASQRQFHVDFLERVIKTNQMNAKMNRSNDYQILAIFEGDFVTDDRPQTFIKNFKAAMAKRNQ